MQATPPHNHLNPSPKSNIPEKSTPSQSDTSLTSLLRASSAPPAYTLAEHTTFRITAPINYSIEGKVAGFLKIKEIQPANHKHQARSFLMIHRHQDLLNLDETQIKEIIAFNEKSFKKQGIAGFIFATQQAHENFAAWIDSKKNELQDEDGTPIKQPDDQDLQKIRDAICTLNPDDNPKYDMLRNISYEENKVQKKARPHIDHKYSVAILIAKGKRTLYLEPTYDHLAQKYQIDNALRLNGVIKIHNQNYHDLEDPALADYVQELPPQGIFFLGRTLHQKPVGQDERTSVVFYGAEAKNQIPDELFEKVTHEAFEKMKSRQNDV